MSSTVIESNIHASKEVLEPVVYVTNRFGVNHPKNHMEKKGKFFLIPPAIFKIKFIYLFFLVLY